MLIVEYSDKKIQILEIKQIKPNVDKPQLM